MSASAKSSSTAAKAPAAPAGRDRAPPAVAKAPSAQSAGNQQVLNAFGMRAPLSVPVGAPGDPLEHEADAVADSVTSGRPLQDIHAAGRSVRRKCTSCGGPMTAAPRLPGGSEPLSAATRAHFEPRFGRDFSDVRVHRYPEAAEGGRQIGARAFTYGRDIAFGAGEYAPHTDSGQWLLAHELTHVVQQDGGQPRVQADGKLTDDDLELIRRWIEQSSGATGLTPRPLSFPGAAGLGDWKPGEWKYRPGGGPQEGADYSDVCPSCHKRPWEIVEERDRLRAETQARERERQLAELQRQREAAWPGMHKAQHEAELGAQATTLAEDVDNSKTSLAQLRLDLFDRALKARTGAGKAPSDSQITQEMRDGWAGAEQATIVLESLFTATADEPSAEISDRIRGAYRGYYASLQRLFAHRDFTERRAQIFNEQMRRQQASCPTASCHQPARARSWSPGLDLAEPQRLIPQFAPFVGVRPPARLSQGEELDLLAAMTGPDKGPRGARLVQAREHNEAAVARAAWKEVMKDYRWATAIVDEQLRAELWSNEEARESLEQFQYQQELLERQQTFLQDHPDALKVRAIFYPKNEFTEKTDDKGAKTEAAKGIPWQFYLTRTPWDDPRYVPADYEWQLHDITAPVRPDRTVKRRYQVQGNFEALARERGPWRDAKPIMETDPPRSLYEELNHKDFFPEGELYWISPITGKPDHITCTASWTFGDWLKAIGMTIAILGSIIFPPAAAAMMAIGTTLSIAGTLHRLHEQSEHGVLTDADIRGAVWDIALDLASIATLGLGKIAVIGRAAGALRVAQGATRAYVFMKGVSLGMDVVNLGLATRDFIVQWQAIQRSNMSDEQKRAALAKLVTFSMLTTAFTVVSARANWKDVTKPGGGLHLDVDEKGNFIAVREPGADAASHVKTRGTEKATVVDRTKFTHPDTGETHSYAVWSDGRITRCSDPPCLTIAESVLTRLDELRERMPKGSAGHAKLQALSERAKALRDEAEELAAGSSKQLAGGTEKILAKARDIEGDIAALEKKLGKDTGWKGRVAPADAVKMVPGGKAGGRVTGAERASGRTGAPLDWPIVKIDPKNAPDVVPDGVVLELPTGERVWRSAGENRAVVIESNLGPGTKRKDFESAYYSRGEMEVPGYVKSDLERAHSQGAGTGFEAQWAIPYAPREVNQELQNLGIEEFVRELQRNRAPGVEYKLVTATSMQPGTRRLSLIEYKIVAVSKEGSATLFTTGIRVEGTLEAPLVSIAGDLTYVHPEAAGLLPLNDLAETLLQRRLDMFARRAAAKKK